MKEKPARPNENLFNALCNICDFIPLEEDMTAIIDAMEKDKKLKPSAKEAEDIMNAMCEEMPFQLSESVKPYVVEAINLGINQKIIK